MTDRRSENNATWPGILALDFDGVILDSIHECLPVAYNAYSSFIRMNSRIEYSADLGRERLSEAVHMRSYIRHGEDYVYIIQFLDEGLSVNCQNDFDRHCETYGNRAPEYRRLFYIEREKLFSGGIHAWLARNPLYPGMADFLSAFTNPSRLHVISTKRRDFIIAVIKGYGLPIPLENIHVADPTVFKDDIIRSLLETYSLEPRELIFVDDQADTVQRCARTGVQVIHANWGYCTPEQVQMIRDNGLMSLSLREFLVLAGRP